MKKGKTSRCNLSRNVCFSFSACIDFLCACLSNNTLHVMFYTYTSYWNTFQYKYAIQITFHVVKRSHGRASTKDIYLLFVILFLCLFLFCLNFVLFLKALLLLRCLIDLVHRCILKFPIIYTFWRDMLSIG